MTQVGCLQERDQDDAIIQAIHETDDGVVRQPDMTRNGDVKKKVASRARMAARSTPVADVDRRLMWVMRTTHAMLEAAAGTA